MGQKKLAMLKVSHDHKKVCLRKHTFLSSNRYSAHDLGRTLLKIEVISRFGPVRFGPVRSARFGSARSGSARSGSGTPRATLVNVESTTLGKWARPRMPMEIRN